MECCTLTSARGGVFFHASSGVATPRGDLPSKKAYRSISTSVLSCSTFSALNLVENIRRQRLESAWKGPNESPRDWSITLCLWNGKVCVREGMKQLLLFVLGVRQKWLALRLRERWLCVVGRSLFLGGGLRCCSESLSTIDQLPAASMSKAKLFHWSADELPFLSRLALMLSGT